MSLAAVTVANAAPTWMQEPAHETADRGGGSKFAALLSTLENETTQVEASSKGAAADGTSAASAATSGESAKAARLAALEAALAGLAGGAPAGGADTASTSASATTRTATSGGATTNAAKSRSTPNSDASAAVVASSADHRRSGERARRKCRPLLDCG